MIENYQQLQDFIPIVNNIEVPLDKVVFELIEEVKGTSKARKGLNTLAINLNICSIIHSNSKANYYIAPEIMKQEKLLTSLKDWETHPSTYYGALIKIKN